MPMGAGGLTVGGLFIRGNARSVLREGVRLSANIRPVDGT